MTIFEFDWDPAKARSNARKHHVSFQEAMAVFEDPLALTIFDEGHSEGEERWVTLGAIGNGRLIVVVHTYAEIEDERAAIRIISARRATKREARQYQDEQAP